MSSGAPVVASADIAVIGGGVVGCAVARAFTLAGYRTILLESAPDILTGASKGNSALLHTGFDAPEGSLELQLMQRGYAEYLSIRHGLNLPLLETGAMVLAWNEEQRARLEGIAAQACANGVTDVELLDRRQALDREPGLSARLLGALLVPGEHVIDPWSAPLAYLTQAVANGAAAFFCARVTGGDFDGALWTLQTERGRFTASQVINCAGLFGDQMEAQLLGEASFRIKPRKGQFVVYDKVAARFFTSILLPVPTERTKGIVVTRTIFGNVLVGPTAEEQEDRAKAAVEQAVLQSVIETACSIIPALEGVPITAVYAGLRPASERKEYRIRHEPARHWLTLGGIRSTGLTAALGLASYAVEIMGSAGQRDPIHDHATPQVPNLAEHLPRDWQRPGYGEIVCHCELVTRREVEATFASPIPPGDFGGLRRRTRAAMGRCQGFYCGARLAKLTQDRFATPLALADL